MSVVVAYVPDETGFFAVVEGVRQARWRQTGLVVVNVVVRAAYSRPTSADEREIDAIESYLAGQRIFHAIRHIDQTLPHPSDEILAVAQETQAELIVVGLKRRSTLARALLGSNAERILLEATCPVLSVRQPD